MPLSTSSLPAADVTSKLPIDVAPRGRNTPTGSANDSPGDFGDLLNNQSATDNSALADSRTRSGNPGTSAKATKGTDAADDTDTGETGELAGDPVESTDETAASSIAWLMANGFIVPPPSTPPPTAPVDLSLPTIAEEGSADQGATELGLSEQEADATVSGEGSAGAPQTALSRVSARGEATFGVAERSYFRDAATVDTKTVTTTEGQKPTTAVMDAPQPILSAPTKADTRVQFLPKDTGGVEAVSVETATSAQASTEAVTPSFFAQQLSATDRIQRAVQTDVAMTAQPASQQQADQVTAVAATTDLAETPDTDGASKKAGHASVAKSDTFALVDVEADPVSPAEKIAAVSDRSEEVASVLDKLGIKKTVTDSGDDVADHTESVGTNAAKSRSAMPTLAAHADHPSTNDATSAFAVTSTDVVASASAVTHPEATSETASAAHRAVESVMAVVDHFRTTGGQHGVNLKFNVGGVDLAVRVEIRGDQVQTTFRTDSPELRSALASEWRVVAADSTDRTQRVAEPVFTSSSGGNSSSGGTTGQEQRGTFTRQDGTAFDEFVASRSALRRATAFTSANVAEVATTTTTSVPAARPGRLHVLA